LSYEGSRPRVVKINDRSGGGGGSDPAPKATPLPEGDEGTLPLGYKRGGVGGGTGYG